MKEVILLNKIDREKLTQKEYSEKFNSVTHKVKTENQNQTYNVKKEGLGPNNQKH